MRFSRESSRRLRDRRTDEEYEDRRGHSRSRDRRVDEGGEDRRERRMNEEWRPDKAYRIEIQRPHPYRDESERDQTIWNWTVTAQPIGNRILVRGEGSEAEYGDALRQALKVLNAYAAKDMR